MGKFMDAYEGLREQESLPCDFECPRCGGPIVYKKSDYSMVPDFHGQWMHWYICEEETCNCSWVPGYIEKWNARPLEKRKRIRELQAEYNRIKEIMDAGNPYDRLAEILSELEELGVTT